MQRLITLLRLARPLHLLLAALTYFLGAGIAHFLGKPQLSTAFWFGLLGVLFAQLSMNLLVEVFRPINEPIVSGETPADRRVTREAALYVSITALASLAVIAFLLYKDRLLSAPAFPATSPKNSMFSNASLALAPVTMISFPVKSGDEAGVKSLS